jgi:hypothetical protein
MHTGADAGEAMAVDVFSTATANASGMAAAAASSVSADSTAVSTSCSADGHHTANDTEMTDTEDELVSDSAAVTAVNSSTDTVHVQQDALLPEVVIATAIVEAAAVNAQQPAAVAVAPLQPAVAVVVPVPAPAAVAAVAAPAEHAAAALAAELSHLMLLKQSIQQILQSTGETGETAEQLATIAFLLDTAADTPPVHILTAVGAAPPQLSSAEVQQLASLKHMQRFVQRTLASASADAHILCMVKFVTA